MIVTVLVFGVISHINICPQILVAMLNFYVLGFEKPFPALSLQTDMNIHVVYVFNLIGSTYNIDVLFMTFFHT